METNYRGKIIFRYDQKLLDSVPVEGDNEKFSFLLVGVYFPEDYSAEHNKDSINDMNDLAFYIPKKLVSDLNDQQQQHKIYISKGHGTREVVDENGNVAQENVDPENIGEIVKMYENNGNHYVVWRSLGNRAGLQSVFDAISRKTSFLSLSSAMGFYQNNDNNFAMTLQPYHIAMVDRPAREGCDIIRIMPMSDDNPYVPIINDWREQASLSMKNFTKKIAESFDRLKSTATDGSDFSEDLVEEDWHDGTDEEVLSDEMADSNFENSDQNPTEETKKTNTNNNSAEAELTIADNSQQQQQQATTSSSSEFQESSASTIARMDASAGNTPAPQTETPPAANPPPASNGGSESVDDGDLDLTQLFSKYPAPSSTSEFTSSIPNVDEPFEAANSPRYLSWAMQLSNKLADLIKENESLKAQNQTAEVKGQLKVTENQIKELMSGNFFGKEAGQTIKNHHEELLKGNDLPAIKTHMIHVDASYNAFKALQDARSKKRSRDTSDDSESHEPPKKRGHKIFQGLGDKAFKPATTSAPTPTVADSVASSSSSSSNKGKGKIDEEEAMKRYLAKKKQLDEKIKSNRI